MTTVERRSNSANRSVRGDQQTTPDDGEVIQPDAVDDARQSPKGRHDRRLRPIPMNASCADEGEDTTRADVSQPIADAGAGDGPRRTAYTLKNGQCEELHLEAWRYQCSLDQSRAILYGNFDVVGTGIESPKIAACVRPCLRWR